MQSCPVGPEAEIIVENSTVVEAEQLGEGVQGEELQAGRIIPGQWLTTSLRHKDRGDSVQSSVA
jgi:hypothetical protein